MAGPGKTIVIIKRASVAALPGGPVPSSTDSRHLNAPGSQPLSRLIWRSKRRAPCHFLGQRQWTSGPAVSVAIIAGLAVAGLATTLVQTVMLTQHMPAESAGLTRVQHTDPVVSVQGPVDDHMSDVTDSSASRSRDPEFSKPAVISPSIIRVVPRRASLRPVRPKFPDAFRGEVLVHEEPVASPLKQSGTGELISGAQNVTDLLSGTLGQGHRIGKGQQQVTGLPQEMPPPIVESMSEPLHASDSD